MYAPTTWATGDVISQAKAANWETQYQEATDETHSSPSISGGTLTLNLNTARVFKTALNANITTLTISNVPSSSRRAYFELKLTYDGTLRTIAWAGSIVWDGGTVPTHGSTNNKRGWFAFFTEDGGTTWFGSVIGISY